MDIAEVKTIQIKNFSLETAFRDDNTHFVIKRNNISQIFCLTIYRNGETSASRGYVSASIIKILKEADPEPRGVKDNLSWTFSVVDVNGVGKYYQSFVKENVAHFHYDISIPKLLERAVLLEQHDEFLPEDILTLRIELSCMSYIGPSIQKDISVDIQFLKEARVRRENNASQVCVNPHGTFSQLECDSGQLFMIMLGALTYILMTRKRFFINAANAQLHKDMLLLSDPMDDITSTYLSLNPIYKLINSLKRKLMKELDRSNHLTSDVLAKEDQYLQKLGEVFNRMEKLCETPGIQFVLCKLDGALPSLLSWDIHIQNIGDGNPLEIEKPSEEKEYKYVCGKEVLENARAVKECSLEINIGQGILEANQRSPGMAEELSSIPEEIRREKIAGEERNPKKVENINLPLAKEDTSISKYEFQSMSFKNDIDFIKEIICYLMSEEEFLVEEDSDNDNQNKWNLIIQTMDGVEFAIPFENGMESFGSKLVSSSPVFETMLKHPMRERFQKMVKLFDIDSQTFINFLNYLKNGDFKVEYLSGVYDVYQIADKYFIKDLMRMCARKMVPFLSWDNIDDVKMLADLHSDDFLLQLLDSFKNENIASDVSHPPVDKVSNNNKMPFSKKDDEQEQEFDFYH